MTSKQSFLARILRNRLFGIAGVVVFLGVFLYANFCVFSTEDGGLKRDPVAEKKHRIEHVLPQMDSATISLPAIPSFSDLLPSWNLDISLPSLAHD